MNNDFNKIEKLLEEAGQAVRLSASEKVKVKNFLTRKIDQPNLESLFVSWKQYPTVRYATIPLIAIFLISGVTVVSADTLPGDLLYPVKTELYEPIRGLTYFSNEQKLAYQESLAEKRLSEMVELGTEGRLDESLGKELLVEFDLHRQNVEKRAENASLEEKVAVESDLESTLRAHERIFADLGREDIQKKIQEKIILTVKSRIKAEAELNLSSVSLKDAAAKKQQEVAEKIAVLGKQIDSFEEDQLALQVKGQINLAEQSVLEGSKDIEAGAYARAIIQYEKASRLAQEADTVFTIQNKYALGPKEISNEEVVSLREKTKPARKSEVAVEVASLFAPIEVEQVDVYQYFQNQLEASGVAIPEAYLSIYPGMLVKDFSGVISRGGIYQVSDGQIIFEPTIEMADNANGQIIESEGYVRLLINIATRLSIEISSTQSVDLIIQKVKEPLDIQVELQ